MQKKQQYTLNEIKKNTIKVTFIGDASVGKSSIATRIAMNEFQDHTNSTIGAAFFSFKFGENGKTFQLWDTAGQERYNALIPLYLRNVDVVIFVYDITKRHTFESLWSHWLPFVRQNDTTFRAMMYLVGNKLDLFEKNHCLRMIAASEAQEKAREHKMIFCEVSARDGLSVKKFFNDLAVHVTRTPDTESDNVMLIEDTAAVPRNLCCY